ncbi:MAG: fused MFS/spermidine synthase [Candidatus Magnetominusculus sp. LBB02]|nr:fused MFS/spermidine synthase [Candidatus Magnetominusculus sp. LBB02]
MPNREVLYYLRRDVNSLMVTRRGSLVTLWCPLKTRQSEADLSNPRLPMLEYARNCLSVLFFVPQPSRILVIGLGGGTIPTALAAASEAVIDVVEIDEAVAGVAKRFFNFAASDRMRLFTGDGAEFVKESEMLYDIIILDAYTGQHLSNSIYSEAFYADVTRILSDKGVAAVNIITGNQALFKKNLMLIHRGFRGVSTLDCLGSNNTVVFAGKNKQSKSSLFQNAGLIAPKLPPGFIASELIERMRGVPLLDRAMWQFDNMM